MKKYIPALLALLLVGAGVAQAQCVSYSLSYAEYTTEALNYTPGATQGGGTITIGGSDQYIQICRRMLAGGDCTLWINKYDTGTIAVTVNGFTASAPFGASSTTSTIATALANAFNTASSPVTAGVSANTVSLLAKVTGTAGDYPVSVSVSSSLGLDSFSDTTASTMAPVPVAHIVASALVDGSASMTLNQATCPYPIYENLLLELPTATHTPQVTSTVNGVIGFSAGTPVCVNCYLSFQSSQDSGLVAPGEEIAINLEGSVDCSESGDIWDLIDAGFAEFAYTLDKFIEVKTNCTTSSATGITYCDYLVAPSCTPNTSPPDLNPTAVDGSDIFPDPNYYDVTGLGFRFLRSSPFFFLSIDTEAEEVYGLRLPAFCTKNDP